jgi:hypothetical protein
VLVLLPYDTVWVVTLCWVCNQFDSSELLFDCCHLDLLLPLLVSEGCAYLGFDFIVGCVRFLVTIFGSVAISSYTNLSVSSTFLG